MLDFWTRRSSQSFRRKSFDHVVRHLVFERILSRRAKKMYLFFYPPIHFISSSDQRRERTLPMTNASVFSIGNVNFFTTDLLERYSRPLAKNKTNTNTEQVLSAKRRESCLNRCISVTSDWRHCDAPQPYVND